MNLAPTTYQVPGPTSTAPMPCISHFPPPSPRLLKVFSVLPIPAWPRSSVPSPFHKKANLTLHAHEILSPSAPLGCEVRHSPPPHLYLKFWRITFSPSYNSIAYPLDIFLEVEHPLLASIPFSSFKDPSSPVSSSTPNFLNTEPLTV